MKINGFDIIWMDACAYLSGTCVAKHEHTFVHFIYVEGGVGEIVIDKEKYAMRTDNIFLIPSFTEHTFSNSGENPLKTIEIKFSFNSRNDVITKLPYCVNVKGVPVKAVLKTILKEILGKKSMSENIIDLNFQLLLLYLARCNEQAGDNALHSNMRKSFPEIDRVIDYIYENLPKEITLEKLAEIAGFEKNYFTRKFKRQTSYTPIIFIRNKRIEKAKQLLRYSDMNVSQIAVETGFKTVHYFSEVFLECAGERPSEYREKNKVL